MDEQAIKRAAEEAVNDLQLDCEIKNVCRSPNKEEWCIQFSGKYGQLCDDFKNQFEKENSHVVIREKIKSHLLKQVSKISRSTGKSRRGRARPPDEDQSQSALAAPIKMIEEAFGRASEIAGEVVRQVSSAADVALETAESVAESVSPATVEIESGSSAIAKGARSSRLRKPVKAAKAASRKSSKRPRSVSRKKAGKQAKKAGKAIAKAVGKAKKSSAKKPARRTGKG
jgi:hypothetical protein